MGWHGPEDIAGRDAPGTIKREDKRLKILVTAKRVTDPDMKIQVKADGSGIELSSMNFKVNPFDEIAIEAAVRLIEAQGGEAVVVSIGGLESETEIKTGLAMGAARGILVQTEEPVDSDAVARLLARLVEAEKPDLVILGKQAVDLDDNQVPQLLAGYLGWGQACFASQIELGEGRATVHREVDGGLEVVSLDLPGVISVDLRLNEPRYPSYLDIMKAAQKEIRLTSPAELGVDTAPKVVIKGYAPPPGRSAGRKVGSVAELVAALADEAKVI